MLKEIEIEKIIEPKRDSRFYRDEYWQQFLTEDIKKESMLIPILVRPIGNDKYEIVDGTTRFYSAKQTNAKSVTCDVQTLSDADALVVRVKLNSNRKKADFMATAQDLKELKDKHGMKMNDLCRRFGYSRGWIYKLLMLNRLNDSEKLDVSMGKVTVTDAIRKFMPTSLRETDTTSRPTEKCTMCEREMSLGETRFQRLCARCDSLLRVAHEQALKRERVSAKHKRLV